MKRWMILVAVVVAMWDGHARAQITAGPKPKPKCSCACKGSGSAGCAYRNCGCPSPGRTGDGETAFGMYVGRNGVPIADGGIIMHGEIDMTRSGRDLRDEFDLLAQNEAAELAQMDAKNPIRGGLMPIGFYAPPHILGPDDLIMGFTATGRSSGQALTLGIVNRLGNPIDVIIPDGLVLQPLKKAASEAMAKLMKNATTHLPVTAHCLDFPKLAPLPGQAFRIAPKDIQDRYKSMRSVLTSVRDLHHADQLEPDSNPDGYRDFIAQWSLWTRGQKWNAAGFTSAFIDKAKKNVEANGRKWTREMEDLTRKSAPGRWRDIGKVLDLATSLEGGR
jgi:hypothetical protein